MPYSVSSFFERDRSTIVERVHLHGQTLLIVKLLSKTVRMLFYVTNILSKSKIRVTVNVFKLFIVYWAHSMGP